MTCSIQWDLQNSIHAYEVNWALQFEVSVAGSGDQLVEGRDAGAGGSISNWKCSVPASRTVQIGEDVCETSHYCQQPTRHTLFFFKNPSSLDDVAWGPKHRFFSSKRRPKALTLFSG